MVIGAADAADDLALQLVQSRGMAPISAAGRLSGDDAGQPAQGLEQELEGAFVLRDGPATPEQAAALDSLLDALDAPLELVISIDSGQEDPADPAPVRDPLWDYYRERGLLRRIRGEGEAADRLATAGRMIDDLERARRPEDEDPFSAALKAIAREAPLAPPTDTSEPAAAEVSAEEPAQEEGTKPAAEAVQPGPGWKRTAARKGRLQRQPAGRKGGRKPRR